MKWNEIKASCLCFKFILIFILFKVMKIVFFFGIPFVKIVSFIKNNENGSCATFSKTIIWIAATATEKLFSKL